MAYGQIRTSSGRELNLSPQGWINNEGQNLNDAPLMNPLARAAMGHNVQQMEQPQSNRLMEAAQIDVTRPVEVFGKKGFYGKNDPLTVYDVQGNKIADLGVDQAATRARMKEDLDIEAKRANLEQTRMQTAQLGNPRQATLPAGYRMTPNGDMEFIPGGPADVKAGAIAQQKALGASDVDSAVATLRDAYNRLEKGGGITSTEAGPLDNIAASASSSGIGQAVGQMFGTNNQSARNDIAMTRPALLASLMKATGMSAKQMDSNAELKLWLATATDPKLDVESNRRALAAIERKYITKQGMNGGGDAPNSQSGQPPSQNAQGWTLHVDGQGRKAYVGPNGQIQEVR